MGIPVTIRVLHPDDWPWIKATASPILCEDTQGFVAVRGEDRLAAVVLDSWSANSCLSHVVIEDPIALRHGLLETTCLYVFNVKGLGLLTGLTPADNLKALKFNKSVGFRETYRISNGYKPGVDFVLQEMRKDECRWILPRQKRAA